MMALKFICPFWGNEQNPHGFVDRVLNAEYSGVEINVPAGKSGLEIVNEIKIKGLTLVAQQWLPQKRESFDQYLTNFRTNCLRLAALEPAFINSHTGKDYFSFGENCRVIEAAAAITRETGVEIHHEIHRGRFTFHPYLIQKYLEKSPDLSITADYSHWCAVCESMLDDQRAYLSKLTPHIRYIHARVGWEQGPQVNNPRAPEWAYALNAHLSWWDEMISYHQKACWDLLICPEFGPAPYMPAEPFSQKPHADQWETNLWMKNLLTERYSN